ncbi:MAG: hypothetical protein LBQ86_05320 [Holophagales bacterium]|jgi:hypothetical protein|nr:hypothetical protein [Holophagales bacterium]
MPKLLSILITLFAVAILACHSDDSGNSGGKPPEPPVKNYTVYTTGTVSTISDNGPNKTSLWENGALKTISRGIDDGKPSEGTTRGNQVFVSDTGDIYVAGYNAADSVDYWFQHSATYWKNGEEITLTEPGIYAEAESIFVVGDNVYVAGNTFRTPSFVPAYPVATLWKNGEPTYFSDPDDWNIVSRAYSVCVSGDDVYVAGYLTSEYMQIYHATIWKNGETQLIGDKIESSLVYSILVSSGNVYAAGLQYRLDHSGVSLPHATIWKNGEPQYLPEKRSDRPDTEDWFNPAISMAKSVFVSGNDVYVAGWGSLFAPGSTGSGTHRALLWKNGEQSVISDGKNGTSTEAFSVFVVNDDVFVAGRQEKSIDGDNMARLWKNGVPQSLNTSGYPCSNAMSVFVVELPPPAP